MKESISLKDKKGLAFSANKISGKGFRCIHDNKEIVAIVKGTDKDTTLTIMPSFEVTAIKDIAKQAEKLGLKISIDLLRELEEA